MNADLRASVVTLPVDLPVDLESVGDYARRITVRGAEHGARWAFARATAEIRQRAEQQQSLARSYEQQPGRTYGDEARAESARRRAQALLETADEIDRMSATI